MKRLLLALAVLASSCTVQKINKSFTKSDVFDKGHLGFMLLDPDKDKVLVDINSDKYFIPASNTKLFTFYTSYTVLGDELVNGLNYLERGDSLIFWGTGDPSLLHPDLKNDVVIEFLKKSDKKLFMVDTFDQVDAFGPGWSWDWYNAYYATERSSMPIYGNVVRFKQEDGESKFSVIPDKFISKLEGKATENWNGYRFRRDHLKNEFTFQIPTEAYTKEFETDIPFITSAELTAQFLSEESGKEINLIKNSSYLELDPKKLQTAPADSIYAQMMKISDNFLAEQLMLLVSDQLNNKLSTRDAIAYAKENLLKDLPDEPIWYDGSGLSSRNMFTPRSIIALLGKIRAEVPLEKIKAYFPAGGESGTIRSWYPADEGQEPYIYAKTGTLSMTNALSGYLITKSGKILHFSCIFNNYAIPSSELKTELQQALYQIHDSY
ncbi:D-alanyl-D-alanine carboxypeptidase [Algoriphagus zhangzhouensis]|uniref:D-alanyl-D-alanine carboxypeptidase / D-alanyl-D-alanine-endopeptidase (Penicillin-binding protein 4) n=1 Tax=Algoriphagus zhangzhouensis TaxID=1073327 RepID=A0A1M7ZHA7_9BACT|nr:D-alanyl-D-alanine carboxypeptidase [Algoriphagus zhangzhouensis]TDY44149.1 D-alanyl-D-alanine carboxypeptidase/D-alanyl-D-alanine-endopeptidase (penicillin-binding protein 4) [Algoriphagus zhangzhouensis]SHO64295.1 D-alanyl-D-alanine carboxypeptidase / D-alanyl-D-alanine-endopeptidase (penicillin-binding protein 4) [Algoriphagus zhangzhouensis]